MRRTLLAGGLMVGLMLAVVQAASAEMTYNDPAGDSGTAPDITAIVVSNDAAGAITFKITFANQPTQATETYFEIFIDSDRNASTGSRAGAEYNVQRDNAKGTFNTYMWDGTKWVVAPGPTVVSSYSGGVWTVTMNKSEIANVAAFDFYVEGLHYSGDTLAASDDAPDGTTADYTYTLTTPPPPPPPPTASVTLGKPATAAPIKAGKPFTIRSSVESSSSPVTVTCSIKIGGKAVRSAGKFAGGIAVCTGAVPKGTTGKKLTGSVTATIVGAKAVKTFAFAIR